MLPAKIQPIEDWAAPRSVKNLQQSLGFAEKHEERSAVLGLRRKASRTFSSSWASRTSIAALLTASPNFKVARLLTEQTKEDAKTALNWTEAARSAFATTLKHLLPWRLFWCISTQKSRRW
jgi:hypothetical protein